MQSWGFKFILGAALEIRCKLRYVRLRERQIRGGFFAENTSKPCGERPPNRGMIKDIGRWN
jgi:hypothetical protein